MSDLERFVEAQDARGTYETAIAELRAGRKRSHWIWFVFPQIAGLARNPSPAAQRYAISSLEEARAYLEHPVLGARLRECAQALVDLGEHDAADVLGGRTDARKLRSSMTLFALAAPGDPLFPRVLEQYFDGRPDAETERRV